VAEVLRNGENQDRMAIHLMDELQKESEWDK
jgi:hypothetical protein